MENRLAGGRRKPLCSPGRPIQPGPARSDHISRTAPPPHENFCRRPARADIDLPAAGLAQRGGNSWENQGNLPVSPEVHPDRSVTFRLFAPKASEVLLVGGPMIAVMGGPKPLVKDERGLWSVTVGPIPAGYYNYGFAVDGGGIRSPDPANPNIEHRQWGHTSFFIVDDTQTQLFQAWEVPHGQRRI